MRGKYLILLLPLLLFAPVLTADESITGVILSPPQKEAGGSIEVKVSYNIPRDYYQGLQEDFFYFELTETPGLSLGKITYPSAETKNNLLLYHGKTVLSAPLFIDGSTPPGNYRLTFRAHYQLCDENGTCFFPLNEEITAGLEILPPATSSAVSGLGLLRFLLLAFLGGLLLNVMPCVLPVLSLKALSLVHQRENNRRGILVGSWLYGAGILVSLMVFASIVTIIKLSGERVGWGFQFQNPAFILALITLIFLFALSLFEVFVITAPGMNRAAGLSTRKGNLGSFSSGIFAVLLATPCTAPFLGTALGFAFSQPPGVIYLIFLFVGVGLALPFLLLGFFPGIIKALPKPGAWMRTFQELMGFLLMATVLWLLSVLYRQTGGRGLLDTLFYLFALTAAAWIYGHWGNPVKKRGIRIAASVIALTIAVSAGYFFLANREPAGREEGSGTAIPSGWEVFDPETLKTAVDENQPVFLSFSAQWCLTCKTNEKTVLLTPWADGFFTDQNIRRFYGDFTSNDPVIGKWIEDFGRAGVPVYVYYAPGKEPVVLPEILSRAVLSNLVN